MIKHEIENYKNKKYLIATENVILNDFVANSQHKKIYVDNVVENSKLRQLSNVVLFNA